MNYKLRLSLSRRFIPLRNLELIAWITNSLENNSGFTLIYKQSVASYYTLYPRNNYFGHSEAIILIMLVNSEQLVLRRDFESTSRNWITPHVFKVPELNCKVGSYMHLIYWQNCELMEFLIAKQLSNNDNLTDRI
ncbi:hypothetical protein CEXT_215781 [Caerostris extrusa]|uniref:Uncharacterized protein n=1 Tax=Caerostris extrusa TaxID=172846 RepID=A0AAV4VIN4_CAEEX|nr:hypothetical protein CEXT_215781 [Caerostris extrusa]